jgi:coenzyme F420-reducing hydrogenase beta subunit
MTKIPADNCCGCTACYNACPRNAIEMKPDFEGFLYPRVDPQKCVQCNVCEQVCPAHNIKTADLENKAKAYIVRTKNNADLSSCTSGGFTMPLANWIFQNQGKVWAVAYDEKWRVRHMEFRVSNEEFSKTRGSKYVQSYLGDAFSQIKNDLINGELICFIGTPCQVYALKYFLKRDYANLITVDLVCHGVPSPKLWEMYIQYQEKKVNSKISAVNFRNKTYGYHSGTMLIEFESGKQYTGSARVDLMLRSFFSEIASRPSCYQCDYKGKSRLSDFTIFDCWHMSELLDGKYDDDKGYTAVLIHSEAGLEMFEQIREFYEVYAADTDEVISLDGIMVENSAVAHPRRGDFYVDIGKEDLLEHVKKYTGLRERDFLIESTKTFAYKLGVMGMLRKIKQL